MPQSIAAAAPAAGCATRMLGAAHESCCPAMPTTTAAASAANAPSATAAPPHAEPAPPAARLVFLPGLANDAEVWADVGAEMARALPPAWGEWVAQAVVADVHTRCASLPAMAHALLAEHAGRLILVGHSMGGMVAQYAVRHEVAHAGRRIAAIALLATTARPDTPALIWLRTEACALFAAGRMDEVLRANVAFAFHPARAANAALVARYFAIVRRAGAEQLIAQNRAVMAREDNRPHLGAIACPTLVLAGEADALTPPEMSREIAAAVPGAELQVLPGCGHMLTLEEPAAVAGRLARWLCGQVWS